MFWFGTDGLGDCWKFDIFPFSYGIKLQEKLNLQEVLWVSLTFTEFLIGFYFILTDFKYLKLFD